MPGIPELYYVNLLAHSFRKPFGRLPALFHRTVTRTVIPTSPPAGSNSNMSQDQYENILDAIDVAFHCLYLLELYLKASKDLLVILKS